MSKNWEDNFAPFNDRELLIMAETAKSWRAKIEEKDDKIAELRLEIEEVKDSVGQAITGMTCKKCDQMDRSGLMVEQLCRSCRLEEKDAEIERLREALAVLVYYSPEHDNYYYKKDRQGVGTENFIILRAALRPEEDYA